MDNNYLRHSTKSHKELFPDHFKFDGKAIIEKYCITKKRFQLLVVWMKKIGRYLLMGGYAWMIAFLDSR